MSGPTAGCHHVDEEQGSGLLSINRIPAFACDAGERLIQFMSE